MNYNVVNSSNVYQFMTPVTWNNSHLCCYEDATCCGTEEYFTQYYKQSNILLEDDTIILRVVSNDTTQPLFWQQTSSSGITTRRNDIQYGSFRMYAKAPSLSGSCFAMYYFNTTQDEIDIEILPYQARVGQVHGSIHPIERDSRGNSLEVSHQFLSSDDDLTMDYHEYRFDWFPTHVDYYLDGVWQFNLTLNTPTIAGRIFFKHWTNGNSLWTQGPPISDSYAYIKNMTFWFNSSTGASNLVSRKPKSTPTITSTNAARNIKRLSAWLLLFLGIHCLF